MGSKLILILIGMIICFGIIINLPFLNLNASYPSGDWRISHVNTLEVMKVALMQGKLPFWTESVNAGMPFYAMPDKPFLYPPVMATLLFLTANQTMNLMLILNTVMGGLFMFLLIRYLVKNEFSAFISAVIFMFSSPMISSPPFWRFSYAWIPLIMYFLIKSIKEERYTRYTIYCGLCLTMMFMAGGIFYFYYTMLFLVGLFLLLNLIFGFVNWKKVVMILVILGLVIGSLCAVKLLPYTDWSSSTNRGAGYSVEQSLGTPLTLSTMFGILIGGKTSETPYQISMVGLVLGIIGLFYWKNKNVMIFSLLIIAILLFNFGFLYSLLYKIVPMLSSQHGVTRSLFVFSFCKCIIVGYGFNWLMQKFKKYQTQIFFGMIILIILNVLFYSHYVPPQLEPYSNQLDGNPAINYLVNQNEKFRFNVEEVQGGIDWSDVEIQSVAKGQEDISQAFGSFYFPDMIDFIGLAYTTDNYAKIHGILNVKYFISGQERNITGLKLVKKVNENIFMPIDFIDGPYIYENEKVLPRVFYPSKTILVVGNENQTKQVIKYMLVNGLDVSKISVVRGNAEKLDLLWGVNNFLVNPISQFDAIVILDGSVNGVSLSLQNYVKNGGKLFPDVTSGESVIDGVSLMNYISELNNISDVSITEPNFRYKQNELVISNPKSGWMVVSDQFYNFPGWTVYADGKWVKMFQSDGIITSIYIPQNTKEIRFVYEPNWYAFGEAVGLFSLGFIVVFLWVTRKK